MTAKRQLLRFERLDALADEASYLNNYSLNESLSSDVYTETASAEINENSIQESNSGSKTYLNCLSNYRKKRIETLPLLPLHESPQTPSRDEPHSDNSAANPYFTLITQFIWTWVFTENIRSYIENNQRQLMLIGAFGLTVIGVALYLTGNFKYLKVLYCFIISNILSPGSVWNSVCLK